MGPWRYNHAMDRIAISACVRSAATVIAMLLAAALVALAFTLSISGCGEAESPPPPVEVEEPDVEYIEGLSADQSRTVAELGYPDHFFISIDPASSDRVERWLYFSEEKAIDFDNGRLFGEEPIADESAEYPPTDLRPQDFDTLLSPGEASQLLGEPLYTQEVVDSLMPENTIVVYGKAILLYREGQLIGVDTQVSPPQLNPP
ncbi:MAG: hypothetical protein JW854_17755 [Actinobacteria bacterium]|nr:hypothetical protein [Actinomycetota bacterium]